MQKNSFVISPLPMIVVHNRAEKVNLRITQMIKKLGKRREMEIIEERSQGFWMEDQVKLTLDHIKLRSHRIKTLPALCSLKPPSSREMKRHNTYNKNNYPKKKVENKPYLPELNQLIEERQSQTSKLIIAKRRKIIHLLILGLNRRNLGRLYQALDIILLASFYFEKDDQERVLKSICLSLISKLHKQIKKQSLSLRRKSKLNKKRKSLTLLNYFSRQNFMENFMMKLRRTKLVGQFSYSDSLKSKSNHHKINAKCNVVIPKPNQIFEEQEQVKNYDYVAVTVDDYTNMLPYEYPKSLSEKINLVDYKQMICKLNGLLFPESKCYSFSSILKIFYLPFMTIFTLMLMFTVLRTFITSEVARIVLMACIIGANLLIGIKICHEESGYTNYIEIKDKMRAYLDEWEQQYTKQNIKFRMGENVDVIFIVFPSQLPDSSIASSNLTEIQQVQQNFTQNHTESKYANNESRTLNAAAESIKGCRRTGSRFQQNGNIMKKKTFSKFINQGKSYKRQLTLNKQYQSECSKQRTQNQRPISQKLIQNQSEKQDNFLFDEIHSIASKQVVDYLKSEGESKQMQSSRINDSKVKTQAEKNIQYLSDESSKRNYIRKINSIDEPVGYKKNIIFTESECQQKYKKSMLRKMLGTENQFAFKLKQNAKNMDWTLNKNGLSESCEKGNKMQVSQSYLITPKPITQQKSNKKVETVDGS